MLDFLYQGRQTVARKLKICGLHGTFQLKVYLKIKFS